MGRCRKPVCLRVLVYGKFRALLLLSNCHQVCPHVGRLFGSWPFHLHNDSLGVLFSCPVGESLFLIECLRRRAVLPLKDRGGGLRTHFRHKHLYKLWGWKSTNLRNCSLCHCKGAQHEWWLSASKIREPFYQQSRWWSLETQGLLSWTTSLLLTPFTGCSFKISPPGSWRKKGWLRKVTVASGATALPRGSLERRQKVRRVHGRSPRFRIISNARLCLSHVSTAREICTAKVRRHSGPQESLKCATSSSILFVFYSKW